MEKKYKSKVTPPVALAFKRAVEKFNRHSFKKAKSQQIKVRLKLK